MKPIINEIEAPCVHCKKNIIHTVHHRIDGLSYPDLKTKVLNSTAFVTQCPHCMGFSDVPQDFRYFDSAGKTSYMIYYFPASAAEELEDMMIEFTTAFAKKFNDEPTVKWMDVVNETILPSGKWFGPKEGTNKWENPWLKIGLDENGFPIYILKSFEIATKYAKNIKLVYNQNAGMQSKLWEKVKESILYIRSKGYRVDGIGWQAHIGLSSSTRALIENTDKELQKLSDLIDWAHQNNLEFHVTELDYFINDNNKLIEGREKQAIFYKKLIETLKKKTTSGVVTLNLWDLGVRTKKGKQGAFHSIYDLDFNPTPAYNIINKAIQN